VGTSSRNDDLGAPGRYTSSPLTARAPDDVGMAGEAQETRLSRLDHQPATWIHTINGGVQWGLNAPRLPAERREERYEHQGTADE
jgi:hypothetical protein